MPALPLISIIIPVLNEAAQIPGLLQHLQRFVGTEVIFVDGGSTDGTQALLERASRPPVDAPRGRANQLNHGASIATGELLLFLHADTRLPPDCMELLKEFLGSDQQWGRFDVRFDSEHWVFSMIAFFMNQRSRLSGICTGDQAIFVRRDTFEAVSGFSLIPIMEDIEVSRRLKRVGSPYRVSTPVVTSSRRWRTRGVFRTILLMWSLRLQYFLGVAPASLARRYR